MIEEKILLDTNFLVAPFQLSVPVFEELEQEFPGADICTLKSAVQEAKSIEEGKYKELVPKLIENQDITVLEAEEDAEVDDLLVKVSDRFVVATNDKELKNRILENGRPVVIIRQGTHLQVLNRRSNRL